MDKQLKGGHVPLERKSMNVCNEPVAGIAVVVEIKQEPDVKEELQDANEVLMVTVPQQHYFGLAAEPGVGLANNQQNIVDLYSSHVKLELKAEAEDKIGSKIESKPKGAKQSNRNDVSMENTAKDEQSKKGGAVPKSSIGKPKKTGVDLKGRAKAVINTAHRKQAKAKWTKKQHKCSSYEYFVPSPAHLKFHMTKHTGEKPFPCSICTKRFSRKSSLQRHFKVHTEGKRRFKCSICLKGFAQNDEKSEHEATCNGRRFECHLCKKYSAPSKSHLKMHMRIHTGDKPFQCNICTRRFTLKRNLNNHSKLHTNPRPMKYQCMVCGRNFLQEVEKEQHEMKCKYRRYECYLCKIYVTYHKIYLLSHIQVNHIDEKSFQCQLCQKCFTSKGHLNRHKKSCTNK